MIYDTDILIWVQRGNEKAAKLIDKDEEKYLSIQSYMELLQGAKNKMDHKYVKDFISEFEFSILPLTENIGHRALIYVEEHSLSSNMRSGDAIICATAVENNRALVSSNTKYFKVVKELELKAFKP
ncbi:MAG: type II toxin-antitoxin system VapC family toxin [Methylococcales symbiont of Hymedesmia sp. n. MRB-2018]|nr:MAG: type II toxin-antitoxin system VapC family toxin [Methylococcales symbiont of Hymedesmia sp. n. MRB-2018]KAF3983461.1 MAG: type II toxin-antitoxin system VapC family toxin [Methylococcales symbiont of Hymedesmia sp. n. MRB-2018]